MRGEREMADDVRRILARGGLARDHDGRRAVQHGVKYVAHLRAGRHARVLHGSEHLRYDHERRTALPAAGGNALLHGGKLPERHGVAEIAARNDDLVRVRQQLRERVHAAAVFDLGEEPDVCAAALVHSRAHGFQIVRAADERLHDCRDAARRRKHEIFPVLRSHGRERYLHARQRRAFAGTEHAAPLDERAVRALGAEPTPLAYSELYLALQQGIVDAQENPLANILSAKFYEVQNTLVLTGHVTASVAFVLSENKWQSLPDDIKEIVQTAVDNAVVLASQLIADNEAAQLEELKGYGMKVETPDLASFKANAQSVIDEFSVNWVDGLYDLSQAASKE